MTKYPSDVATAFCDSPEMVTEVEREIALRKRVYPRWVKEGKIKPDRAERQLEVMEAVALHLATDYLRRLP